MPEWTAYCEENRNYALKRIRNMALSIKYRKELSLWINNYLDPFYIRRAVIEKKKDFSNPFELIRTEAEKDLEFTVLSATKRDRSNIDVIMFESNLLLMFNMLLSRIRAS
ncbi:hypothetical protein HWN40_00315 [Methanolobus zinderi]|jgi:hypothetical protein|uniref:Uncharacterized protein n=1 Tax=Methanolobus zinderi TaxID=536044 RepID=A0A7D5IMT8_9EURY|nr:hypothetical protein [Methanolobus zinderi]KXS43015.1 MAG: hypothetical protein AWU59_1348 [Methanolobus sp. T82-4]QLC48827.1 hypothetical protein HWN40_00315 [Methanolobus zinderi]